MTGVALLLVEQSLLRMPGMLAVVLALLALLMVLLLLQLLLLSLPLLLTLRLLLMWLLLLLLLRWLSLLSPLPLRWLLLLPLWMLLVLCLLLLLHSETVPPLYERSWARRSLLLLLPLRGLLHRQQQLHKQQRGVCTARVSGDPLIRCKCEDSRGLPRCCLEITASEAAAQLQRQALCCIDEIFGFADLLKHRLSGTTGPLNPWCC